MFFRDLSDETLTRLSDSLRFLEAELCRRHGWRRRGRRGRSLHETVLMASRAYGVSGSWLACLIYAALFAPTDRIPSRTPWEKVEQWETSRHRRPHQLRKLLKKADRLVRREPTPS